MQTQTVGRSQMPGKYNAMQDLSVATGGWIDLANSIRAELRQDGVSSHAVEVVMAKVMGIAQKAYSMGTKDGIDASNNATIEPAPIVSLAPARPG